MNDDRARGGGTGRMLEQVARVLDVPADLFRAETRGLIDHGERCEAFTEVDELVRLFSRIQDPEARQRCLAFVRAEGGNPG